MIYNEEQRLLQTTLNEFLREQSPVACIRELRDNPLPTGFDPAVWQALCELGVSAIAASEEAGGLGFGALGLCAVMEELGRHLTATPMLSSVVLAGKLFEAFGSPEQQAQWLPGILSGESIFCVGLQEGKHFNLSSGQTSLSAGKLTGTKRFVLDAAGATHALILTDDSNGPCFAIVELAAAGVEATHQQLMDGRSVSMIALASVPVEPEQILDSAPDPQSALERTVDIATLAISAEMLAGARELLTRTVAYLNEREQFDVKLGSFQALQHRCAQMLCELELAQSTLLRGFLTAEHPNAPLGKIASHAKYLANECYKHLSNEAVQMHGGMGITDEVEIGLFLKRARVCCQILGDSSYHGNRFAALSGF